MIGYHVAVILFGVDFVNEVNWKRGIGLGPICLLPKAGLFFYKHWVCLSHQKKWNTEYGKEMQAIRYSLEKIAKISRFLIFLPDFLRNRLIIYRG